MAKSVMYVRGLLCLCGMSGKAPPAPLQSSGRGKGCVEELMTMEIELSARMLTYACCGSAPSTEN